MDWRALLEPEAQEFMQSNANADVRKLALKKPPGGIFNYPQILDQIKTRQKAVHKTPDLCAVPDFIFPPSGFFEQASSSACARYKANLVAGDTFMDLTAGCGVDAFFMAKRFSHGMLIEKDQTVSEMLKNNTQALGKSNFFQSSLQIYNEDAEEFLSRAEAVDLIYIDPQRREEGRKGIFDLQSCSPDIVRLLPMLCEKSKRIMIKTSPVLDIHHTIVLLGYVRDVHVVGWDGDCKEVVYILDSKNKTPPADVTITAVDLDQKGEIIRHFSYRYGQEKEAIIPYEMPKKYIAEPAAPFQKAGGFNSMSKTFEISKLHPNSHLYTSDFIMPEFPGKFFEVIDVVAAQAKNVTIRQAELSLRNFPGKMEELRAKLKLKEGGNHRIFATTLYDETIKLIICRKLS